MGRRKRKSHLTTDGDQKKKKQRLESNGEELQKQSKNNKKGKKQNKRGPGKSNSWTWVENCKEVVPKGGDVHTSFTVVLTRVELRDDHNHSKSPKKPATTKPDDEDEKKGSESSSSEDSSKDGDGDKKEPEKSQPLKNTQNEEKEKSKEYDTEKAAENISSDNIQSESAGKKVDVNQLSPGTSVQSKTDESKQESEKVQTQSKNETAAIENAFIRVKRANSAKGMLKFPFKAQKGFKHLPNGDCGDGVVNPHPKHEVPDKYWAQRKRLFSRFDDGIKLDKEGWYSVTPEAIANHVSNKIAKMIMHDEKSAPSSHKKGCVILDAFCGCGGNAISFAKVGAVSTVVCIDNDRSKLKMAAQNAMVYGISPEKLILIESDACVVIDKCYNNGKLISDCTSLAQTPQYKVPNEAFEGFTIGGIELLPECIDAIFLSPPWGGIDYQKVGKRGYDISTCMKIHTTANNEINDQRKTQENNEINGEQLLAMAAKGTKDKMVIFFLPRNTDGVSLGRSALKAGYKGSIELEQNMLNGKLKTLTAYFGNKSDKHDSSIFQPPSHSTS